MLPIVYFLIFHKVILLKGKTIIFNLEEPVEPGIDHHHIGHDT